MDENDEGLIRGYYGRVAGILDALWRRAVAGRGRTAIAAMDPTALADLKRLADPTARGEPKSLFRQTRIHGHSDRASGVSE